MYIMLFLQNKELFNSTVICLLEFIPFMNDELVIYFLKIKSYFFTNFKIYFFHFFYSIRSQSYYHSLPIFIKVLVWLVKQLEFCCIFVCKRYVLISRKTFFLINFLGHFFNQRFVFALIVDNYSSIISFTRRKILWYWHTRRWICLPRVGFKYNRGM